MANVLTPKFRVSYPNVLKAKRNELNGKDEYGLVALFPKGCDLTVLKKAAQEAIVAKWGSDNKKWPANLRTPFRDQAEKSKSDEASGKKTLPAGHEEGAIFINLKSTNKPGVVNERNEDIINETDFYAGCWAHATVRAYAYDNKGNRGVSFGLQNIQKVKDGDTLGSRTKAQDDFAPIEGATTSDATGLF
jgi:hypothetical protein